MLLRTRVIQCVRFRHQALLCKLRSCEQVRQLAVGKERLRRFDHEVFLTLAQDKKEVLNYTGGLFGIEDLFFFEVGLLLNKESIFPGAEGVGEYGRLFEFAA